MIVDHLTDPERRAECAIDEARAARRQWERKNRPPRLSAREALAAMQFECLLIWTYGKWLLNGNVPAEGDEQRVTLAMRRINELSDEALG